MLCCIMALKMHVLSDVLSVVNIILGYSYSYVIV